MSSSASPWPWPWSGRPEVAFLDEPTAGVDPEGRLTIRAVVAELKEQGVCVVLTTHELTEAERLADRIVILAAGRVARQGTPGELAAAAAGPPAIVFGAPPGLDTAGLADAVGPGTSVSETEPGPLPGRRAQPPPDPRRRPPSPPGWPGAASP